MLIATPFVSLVLWGGLQLYSRFEFGIDDAYAEWGAADLVIGYMDSHHGQWPPDWEALRPSYDGGRVGWSFEKYRRRIHIDFTADPVELRRQSLGSKEAAFEVIAATKRTGVHMGDGPNRMLRDYFRSNGRAKQASHENGR